MKYGLCVCAAGWALVGFSASALAVSPFFTETFPDAGNVEGWAGGSASTNPGTGGVDGAGDGFLQISQENPGRFGLRNFDPEYSGDYVAAGVTAMTIALKDVGEDEEFSIHVGFGTQFNFYLYNEGFNPSSTEWETFFIDMVDPAKWTQIGVIGGTFSDALMGADRMLIRHDVMPFGVIPNGPVPIAGDVGVDNIAFLPAPGPIALLSLGGIAALRRKR